MLRVAEHVALTDTGRQRRENEDACFARAPLFVVADGMGGAQAGEVASRTAVDVFSDGLPDGDGSVEQRLAALVAEANARIHALAQGDEQRAGMGTTLTAAYLDVADLAVAHVGDSRLYCLRDGALEQRTDDHSLVGELVRRGQLSPEEAEEHPQRSIITRALGPEGEVAVDHHTWPARDGDVFLLCSDGLTTMVPDDKVAELLLAAPDLRSAAKALIEAANAAGGRDNITVILFRVEEVAGGAEQATGAVPRAESAPAPSVDRRVPRAPVTEARARRRWPKGVRIGIVVAILLFIVGSAGWIAVQSVWFVGVSDEGFVTLYRGVPYELPGGIDLYGVRFESGVPLESLPTGVQRTVVDHELRSFDDARDLVRQMERGELAGQR
jgi:protein phosphatase